LDQDQTVATCRVPGDLALENVQELLSSFRLSGIC